MGLLGTAFAARPLEGALRLPSRKGVRGMTAKIQGEGNYDAARHYDEKTRKFVEEKQKSGEELKGSSQDAQPQLTEAEREALRHAKRIDEDRRDADDMRKREEHRKPQR
jgi:hypothetical protein